MIRCDPIEPCSKLAFSMERAETRDRFDQYFLGDFFCIVRMKHHANGNVVIKLDDEGSVFPLPTDFHSATAQLTPDR